MSNKVTFTVSARTVMGKQVKQLRRDKLVPANIYGVGSDSVAVQCASADFLRLYDKAGETTVVYLQLNDDQEKPVLIDEVGVDPVTGDLLHVSFKQVNLRSKIEAEVPVEVIGEFKVPGAVLVTVLDHIVVEALPTDLPEKFEVDASTLTEVGQMITLGDLNYDKTKVRIVEVETDEDLANPVLMAQEQREEEEEVIAPEAVEITGEKAATEGEAEADKSKTE
jgi:large subunit ribosomal protein L25